MVGCSLLTRTASPIKVERIASLNCPQPTLRRREFIRVAGTPLAPFQTLQARVERDRPQWSPPGLRGHIGGRATGDATREDGESGAGTSRVRPGPLLPFPSITGFHPATCAIFPETLRGGDPPRGARSRRRARRDDGRDILRARGCRLRVFSRSNVDRRLREARVPRCPVLRLKVNVRGPTRFARERRSDVVLTSVRPSPRPNLSPVPPKAVSRVPRRR